MNLYQNLPSRNDLIAFTKKRSIVPGKVNGHFHTPYSFSAFSKLEQVITMATEEHIDVLGINDFYTMAGYDEFAGLCLKNRKFPLFNIEFMGLLKREQSQGIRVNDPNNPGRTYFSGKGLDFPISLSGSSLEKLTSVRNESDKQASDMVRKASEFLEMIDPDLILNYDDILENYTKGMVRERHIAQVIRSKVFEKYEGEESRKAILKKIYRGIDSKADINDTVSVDGEIRGMLLKSGGVAFVKEDPKAFLDISEVIQIIRDAGGIPCYPVLLDDKNGDYTEYESDMQVLYKKLSSMNVYSLELIPGRNKLAHFKPFVAFFDKKGFVITFGTEHNTPALDPLTVSVGDSELDDYLLRVSYEGACVTAAHQYLRSQGEAGFLSKTGIPGDKQAFISLGNAVIQNFINQEQ